MLLRIGLLLLPAACAWCGLPRLPFSGVHGATAGAGSLAGWERAGPGNPAAKGPPGTGVSLAGYAPFGLEDLRLTELTAYRDAAGWGASLGLRALASEEGGGHGEARAQWARPLGRNWLTGAAATLAATHGRNDGGNWGGEAGFLWRPRSSFSLGAAWEGRDSPSGTEHRAGIGADAGGRFGRASAWRISAETRIGNGETEHRFGAGLRLHALLSLHAGWAPRQETAALGVRFGMGGWEGFSAMRRHSRLGGTSIQGLKWRRDGG